MSAKKSSKSELVELNTATDGGNNDTSNILENQSPDETVMTSKNSNNSNNSNNGNDNTSETICPGDDGEATSDNDTTANEQLQPENETGEPASAQDITAAWTEAWDDQSQAYYWWNTITYETSWENPNDTTTTPTETTAPATGTLETTSYQQEPLQERNELDSVLDAIDTKVRAKLDGPSNVNTQNYQPSSSSSAYPDSFFSPSTSTYNHQVGAMDPYRFQAFFNTKTGRFQNSTDLEQRNPDQYTMEARAKRQMEHYFDVDAYQDQRNQASEQGRKRSLSRKEVERFKRAKKEKKANRMRDWLRD